MDVTVSSVIYWNGTIDEDGNALAMFQKIYDYYVENNVLLDVRITKNPNKNQLFLTQCRIENIRVIFTFYGLNYLVNSYENPILYKASYQATLADNILSNLSALGVNYFNFGIAHVFNGTVAYGGCLDVQNTVSYTPTSDYNPATKKYVDDIVSTISTLSFQVVTELPTTDIQTNIIYLVPSTTSSEQNIYDEYIYINSTWEKIGSTAIDLSNYLAKDNTTAYTPTGDYNPATKQYVDDNIFKTYIIDYWNVDKEVIKSLILDFENKKAFSAILKNNADDTTSPYFGALIGITEQDNNYQLCFIGENANWNESTNFGITTIMGRYYMIEYDPSNETVTTTSKGLDLIVGGLNILGVNNTQEYTPTNDYNPATKKYVDDTIVNQSTIPETITGLKTFTTLPQSSVAPTADNQLVNKAYVDSTLSTALGNINTILATLTTVSEVTE